MGGWKVACPSLLGWKWKLEVVLFEVGVSWMPHQLSHMMIPLLGLQWLDWWPNPGTIGNDAKTVPNWRMWPIKSNEHPRFHACLSNFTWSPGCWDGATVVAICHDTIQWLKHAIHYECFPMLPGAGHINWHTSSPSLIYSNKIWMTSANRSSLSKSNSQREALNNSK